MDYERDVLDVKSHNEDEENQLRPQSFEEQSESFCWCCKTKR